MMITSGTLCSCIRCLLSANISNSLNGRMKNDLLNHLPLSINKSTERRKMEYRDFIKNK